MGVFRDLTGHVFGRLTVVERAGSNKHAKAMWRCRCSCEPNAEKVVCSGDLTSGKAQSCGCLRQEVAASLHVKDLTGATFGRWTVIERAGSDKHGKATWLCRCSCELNIEKVVSGSTLLMGESQSCGCHKRDVAASLHVKDLTGQVFGRLTVLERVGSDKRGKALWRCLCSCNLNAEKVVIGTRLINGVTQSCGCLQREVTSRRATIHGQSKTTAYHRKRSRERTRLRKNTFFPDRVNRKILINRDGHICAMCGVDTTGQPFRLPDGHRNPLYATHGHIVPVARGGRDHLANGRVECWGCNRSKRDNLDEELFAEDLQRVKDMQPPRYPRLYAKVKEARKRPRRAPPEPAPSLF